MVRWYWLLASANVPIDKERRRTLALAPKNKVFGTATWRGMFSVVPKAPLPLIGGLTHTQPPSFSALSQGFRDDS